MPGNDFVIKQNVLGSAAGIALLAFALAWRFLPSFGGGAAPEKSIAEPPSSAPMSVQAPKQTAPVTPVVSQEAPVEEPAPLPAPAKPAPPPPKAIAVPGIMMPTAWMLRPVGSASSTSRVITVRCVMPCTSTTGDSADTVIVSSTAPTFISTVMVAVKSDVSSPFSRRTTL